MCSLHQILSNLNPGTFFEAGANDGVTESNTRFLEDLGWTGILVEPHPEQCHLCQKTRKGKTIHGALVSSDYKKPFIAGNFLNGKGHSSLMCAIFDVPNYFSDHQKNEINEKINEGSIEVPAFTIQEILDKENINDLTFLSLDLEGYELAALTGLNFNKIKPTYILIETANNSVYQNKVKEYLQNIGYDYYCKISGNDDLFKLG
jgi:FkbM family methyltransferase